MRKYFENANRRDLVLNRLRSSLQHAKTQARFFVLFCCCCCFWPHLRRLKCCANPLDFFADSRFWRSESVGRKLESAFAVDTDRIPNNWNICNMSYGAEKSQFYVSIIEIRYSGFDFQRFYGRTVWSLQLNRLWKNYYCAVDAYVLLKPKA